MSPDRFKAVENLYHAALEIEPERRSAFIEEACAGDDSLRSEVQMLLGLDRQAGDFLGEPAIEVVARQAAQKPRDSLVGWQLGSYELEELVGAGGMGEVYRAHDRSLRRVTAIKLLTEELRSHPQFKQRFLREARAAALLNHPNIAQIYEVGESNGVTYLAMEYVNGETLAAKVGKWQTCPQMVVDVALQTAAALKEAQAAGLI
ncbi:MAG: protein kinase domain-containing protein, partial [Bryobacteraceae bacterium]